MGGPPDGRPGPGAEFPDREAAYSRGMTDTERRAPAGGWLGKPILNNQPDTTVIQQIFNQRRIARPRR